MKPCSNNTSEHWFLYDKPKKNFEQTSVKGKPRSFHFLIQYTFQEFYVPSVHLPRTAGGGSNTEANFVSLAAWW